MRRSLLNKLNTPKALRQALVLFTMLLLPSTAWGQDPAITIDNVVPDENGYFSGISGVTYDATSKTLTLNNAELTKGILWNDNDNLTVNLIGSNSISIPQDSPCISSGYSRTLSFTRGDTNNPCSLTLLSEATIDVFNGFSNASSPTVTGLYAK